MTEADAVGGEPTTDVLSTPQAGPAAIRGGALRVGGYVFGAVLSAAGAAVLFRHLGVVDTGRYVTALSLVAIVAGVSDLGLTAIGVRELSVRTGESRSRLARNLLGLRLVLTVAGVAAVTAFAAAADYGSVLVAGVALAGVGVLLQSLQGTLAISLVSDLRLGWVAAGDLLRTVISVALIVALVLVGATLLPFLAVGIPASAVVLALTVALVRGTVPLRPGFERHEWWALLRVMLPYVAAVAAAAIYFRVAVVLVSLLASATELGYFSASSRIIEAVLVIPGLLVGAAFPIFARSARDDRARLAYALARVFEVSLIVGVWVALCLALGASLAIKIIGGSSFAPAATMLAIQSVGLAGSFVGAVWANGLLSLERYRAIMMLNLGALGLGSALVALLVTVDGGRGAAIATSVAEVALAVLSGIVLARSEARLTPPLAVVPRVALGAALAAAPALIPGLPVVGRVILATVIYAATLWALGAIPEELRELMRSPRSASRASRT